MNRELMSREETIEKVGIKAVEAVDIVNCEFTNSVYEGSTVEFSASITFGEVYTLFAYYYQDKDKLNEVENLDELEWEVAGYEIIYL